MRRRVARGGARARPVAPDVSSISLQVPERNEQGGGMPPLGHLPRAERRILAVSPALEERAMAYAPLMTTSASEKRLIGLLTAITTLLAVLVVGVVLAGALAVVPAVRYAQRLEAELALTRAQTQELAGLARTLRASEQQATRDLERRQGLMGRALSAEASRSAALAAALKERRQRLERDPGPAPPGQARPADRPDAPARRRAVAAHSPPGRHPAGPRRGRPARPFRGALRPEGAVGMPGRLAGESAG